METIGIPVRKIFLRLMHAEVLEAQDKAEWLYRSGNFSDEVSEELKKAYESLFAARVQVEQELEQL